MAAAVCSSYKRVNGQRPLYVYKRPFVYVHAIYAQECSDVGKIRWNFPSRTHQIRMVPKGPTIIRRVGVSEWAPALRRVLSQDGLGGVQHAGRSWRCSTEAHGGHRRPLTSY